MTNEKLTAANKLLMQIEQLEWATHSLSGDGALNTILAYCNPSQAHAIQSLLKKCLADITVRIHKQFEEL